MIIQGEHFFDVENELILTTDAAKDGKIASLIKERPPVELLLISINILKQIKSN